MRFSLVYRALILLISSLLMDIKLCNLSRRFSIVRYLNHCFLGLWSRSLISFLHFSRSVSIFSVYLWQISFRITLFSLTRSSGPWLASAFLFLVFFSRDCWNSLYGMDYFFNCFLAFAIFWFRTLAWLFSDLFRYYVVVWQPNSVWMCCVVVFSVYRLNNGTFFFIVWICG